MSRRPRFRHLTAEQAGLPPKEHRGSVVVALLQQPNSARSTSHSSETLGGCVKTYGLSHEQLAMVSVVQREWAVKKPRATVVRSPSASAVARRQCVSRRNALRISDFGAKNF